MKIASLSLLTCLTAVLSLQAFGLPVSPKRFEMSAEEIAAQVKPLLEQAHLSENVSRPELIDVIVRALAESFTLAEVLQSEFDLLLDKGFTIESLQKAKVSKAGRGKPTTYAQLSSLRAIQEQLENALNALAIQSFNESVDSQASDLDFLASLETAIHNVKGSLADQELSLAQQKVVDLALEDVTAIAKRLETYLKTGNADDLYEKTESEQNLNALREYRKGAIVGANHTVKLLQELGTHHIDVSKWNLKLAKEMQEQLVKLANEGPSPTEVETFKVQSSAFNPAAPLTIFPSNGREGNITGSSFPAKTWSLTFDDGPSVYTKTVLDNLKKHGLKATFFMLSQQIDSPKKYINFAYQEFEEGHENACHSYTHAQVNKLGIEGRKKEIKTAADVFMRVMSHRTSARASEDFLWPDSSPKFYRLPYGAGVSVAAVRADITKSCMVHVFWNVDTLDWHDKDPEVIYNRTVKQINSLHGGIILFHDIHPQSVVASEKIMTYLQTQKLIVSPVAEVVKQLNGGQNFSCQKQW